MPFLCDKSAESLDMSEVEGDSAGGDTEKSLGGNSASSSLDTAPRWSPPTVSVNGPALAARNNRVTGSSVDHWQQNTVQGACVQLVKNLRFSILALLNSETSCSHY